MTRPAFRPAFYPAFRPAFNKLKSISAAVRSVYNLDGIDDRVQLGFRAINPDGNNTFEFWSPSAVPCFIISQNISAADSSREFTLGRAADGSLSMVFGGVFNTLFTAGQGFKPATSYGLSLIGNQAQVFEGGLNGTLVRTTTFTRGAAREPSAQTIIGARGNGSGSFTGFFQGLQYNIRINDTLWPMADRGQSIQLPSPSGFGSELINQVVLENPAVKGSQWNYLGDGRWHYIGDGSSNELRFLTIAATPAAGFLEFEVESYTGAGQMRVSSVVAGTGDRVWSGVGVKRWFYTSGIDRVSFDRNSGILSCVIKNISFKPLGSCNPLQLINTTPDRWEEVAA